MTSGAQLGSQRCSDFTIEVCDDQTSHPFFAKTADKACANTTSPTGDNNDLVPQLHNQAA
jgi:hypothetical protein